MLNLKKLRYGNREQNGGYQNLEIEAQGGIGKGIKVSVGVNS